MTEGWGESTIVSRSIGIVSGEPARDKYDVVIIGAGLAGLTCGGLLAREGLKVLVADQRPAPGGVCHSFRRGDFIFDVGPHLLSGCGEGWVVHRILKSLGADGEVEFIPVNPLAKVVFPDYAIEVPPSFDAFIQALAQRFPEEVPKMGMLFREMLQMYMDVDSLPATFGLWDFLKVPVTHPIFFKYPNKTYLQMMDEFLLDDRLKSIIAGLWVYFGLPPSKISSVFWTIVMMTYFLGGGYYPKGGLGQLAGAFAKGLANQGGELALNTMVDKIVVKDGQAVGVEVSDASSKWLADGHLAPQELAEGRKRRFIAADYIISNGDARRTFLELVGTEHLPGNYIKTLQQMEPSLSLIKVALGVDVELRGTEVGYHDTVFFDSYDMDKVFQDMKTKLPEAACDVTIPSISDPTLAPPGKHCVYLWNYAPYDAVKDWERDEDRAADRLVQRAERVIPGLSKHIVARAVMTPLTMHRYALTTEGAPYGWAFSPGQMGFGRLQPRSPIKGLYLAGHWTTPGAGVAGVVMSGERTAEIIKAKEGFAIWRKSA